MLLFSIVVAIASFITPMIVRLILKHVHFKYVPRNYILYFALALLTTYVSTILHRLVRLNFSLSFKCKTLRDLFEKLFVLKLAAIYKSGPTYYTERIISATDKIFNYLSEIASGAIVPIISMIVSLFIIFTLNKLIFIMFFLLIPVNFLSYRRLNYKLQQKCVELQKVSATNLKNVINIIQNIETIKQFINFKPFLQMLGRYVYDWQKKIKEVNQYASLMSATINFFTECIRSGILLFTCFYFLTNRMVFADVVFINLIFSIYFTAISDLNNMNINYRDVKASLNFIIEEIESLKENYAKGIELHRIETISFEIKKFGYSTEKIVLKNIQLEICRGDRIGIVGKVGSGKSTVTKLLMRYYNEFEGIKINGKNIKQYKLASIRQQIFVVSQMPSLFPGSIRDNIVIGLEQFDEEKLQTVINLPFFRSFIKEMFQGIDTEIGEGGFNLSGGQKQLIMIVRCLMHNPSVIIFDESTSSMDSRLEEQIYKEIEPFIKDKIVIKISHRLSALKDCNKLVVLKGGVIEAIGTHEKLLKTSNEYRKLFRKQLLLETPKIKNMV